MVNRWPAIVRASQRVCEVILKRYEFLVNTPPNKIDIISAKGGHLRKFDRFRYIDRFYSTAMSRAGNDLDPVGISAAGYDLVIMDTPHYVRVKNIRRSRIFTVVHDLIPLNDPYYEQTVALGLSRKNEGNIGRARESNLRIGVFSIVVSHFISEAQIETPDRSVSINPKVLDGTGGSGKGKSKVDLSLDYCPGPSWPTSRTHSGKGGPSDGRS